MRTKIKVKTSTGWFEVITRSPRRYIVVDVRGQYVERRTDSLKVADSIRRREVGRYAVYDQVKEEFK